MAKLEHWVWFASLRGLLPKSRRLLLEQLGDAEVIYNANEHTLRHLPLQDGEREALRDRDLSSALHIIDRCREENVQILTWQDAAYPERLRNIPDPPYVLYVLGRLPPVDSEPVIGMVGTRGSSPYGEKMARSLAYEIASAGCTVVTGLAGGIDSRAAEGALMADGSVIGVLGTAINEVYPRWNTNLFADVRVRGALVSEYPPDTPGSRSFFPARNRIIAGLAVGVVVVEAPERSGALITAARALDYGREVFAVPGNADSENCRGSNQLLREGAMIAENGSDILNEFSAVFPERIGRKKARAMPEERVIPEANIAAEAEKKPRSGLFKLHLPSVKLQKKGEKKLENQLSSLNETQLKIVSAIDRPNTHVDDIIERSGLTASAVLSELTMLEINGWVRQSSGKRFTLNIMK